MCHLLLGLPRLDSHVWPPFSFHQPLQGSWSPNCPWARGWLARNHPCWCGSDVPQWGVDGIRWGGSLGVGDILQASTKLEDLPEMWIVFLGKPMIFHSYLSWSGYFLHFNAYFHRFAVKTDDSICDSLLVAFILAEWSLQVSSPMALWDCTLTLISELSIWIRNIYRYKCPKYPWNPSNIHIKYSQISIKYSSIVGLCKSFCLFQLSYVALVKHLETPQRQGPSGDDGGTDLFVQKMRGDWKFSHQGRSHPVLFLQIQQIEERPVKIVIFTQRILKSNVKLC